MNLQNGIDVFRFGTALVLLPVVVGLGRRIRMPSARLPFFIGYLALVVAFGTSVAQPLWNTDFLRTSRHVIFSLAGFGFAWAAWQARRFALREGGGRR